MRAEGIVGASSRSALSVTSTVAPASAKIAGQSPVTPKIVVARNAALRPRATVSVLPDNDHDALRQLDHAGHIPNSTVQDCSVGCLKRHIGAAAHGDTYVSRGKRRRVIDTVANLRGREPQSLEFTDDAPLVLGQQLRPDFDTELLSNRGGGALVVTGQQ